jgi:hypothetical protein
MLLTDMNGIPSPGVWLLEAKLRYLSTYVLRMRGTLLITLAGAVLWLGVGLALIFSAGVQNHFILVPSTSSQSNSSLPRKNSLGYPCHGLVHAPTQLMLVHVPKTGGTAVTRVLAHLLLISPQHYWSDDPALQNMDPDPLLFSMVRHPLDRMRSWYTYCQAILDSAVALSGGHKMCAESKEIEFRPWVRFVLNRMTAACGGGGKECEQQVSYLHSHISTFTHI